MDFIRKHRQLVLWAGILVLILGAVYVTAMLKTGIWYGDTFLREEETGFCSRDGSQSLQIQYTTEGARAVYQRDGESREFRLSTKTRMTEIFEDGRLKFRGSVQKDGSGGFRFLNERGEEVDGAKVFTGGPETGFPNAFEIYTWVMEDHHAIRGNPGVLVFLGIFGVLLGADAVLAVRRKKTGEKPVRVQQMLLWILPPVLLVLLLLGFHHF